MKNSLKLLLNTALVTMPLACAHSIDVPVNEVTHAQKIQRSINASELHSVNLTSSIHLNIKAGFLIDQENRNHPAIQMDGKNSGVWLFPEILQSIFTINQGPAVNDALGNVYTLEYPNWVLSSMQLKPMSKVLPYEPTLVACTKPAVSKASGTKGECYSESAGWNFAYDLRAAAPAICGEVLRLISREKAGLYLKEIVPISGQVRKKLPLPSSGGDICDIGLKIGDAAN